MVLSERIVLLGASRGLGENVAMELSKTVKHLWLSSRNGPALKDLCQRLQERGVSTEMQVCDFSRQSKALEDTLFLLEAVLPTRIFYFAGGGPFGEFESKEWKDHQWALEVSFLFPAKLIHAILKREVFSGLKQIVCIGSQVAESRPDPMAASYCAAKHGLKGLLSSLNEEGKKIDMRLFSPPYMDTQMLPPNSQPRVSGQKIIDPKFAAIKLVSWTMGDTNHWHYILKSEDE